MSSEKPKAILLDIEGTTTSISFVHDVLFPFASQHLESFLRTHASTSPDVQDAIRLIRQQAEEDLNRSDDTFGAVVVPTGDFDASDVLSAVVENVRQAMKRDRKLTGLKKLQGMIWKEGYESGNVKAHVYPDVLDAFKRWKPAHDIYIYSSGSISAQKLLFQYTESGNLLEYLSGYFDTTTGPKVESSSYVKIAEAIKRSPSDVLFCTDNVKEAKAAVEAGMPCLISERPGNVPLTSEDREVAPVITSFDAVDAYLQ